MPYDILLTQLTGKQLGSLKNYYAVLPTPLERIEIILSRVEHTISNMFAKEVTEFTGSIIPSRSRLWEEIDLEQNDQDEASINANLHMHMVAINSQWGV